MTKQALPFVAPFALFFAFLIGEGWCPDQHYLVYVAKTICVGAVILWVWQSLPSLAPKAPVVSVLIGIVGVVLWVGLDPWSDRLDAFLTGLYNHVVTVVGLVSWQSPVSAPAVGRNPFELYPTWEAWGLFGFRIFGIAIVVPITEELFWRGFLMRWLIKEEFTEVPLGTYAPLSFWVTTAFFAAEHGGQWILGVIVGVIYGIWFIRTKSLGSVMLAHGVTNLLLALYCLETNDWHFLSTVAPSHS